MRWAAQHERSVDPQAAGARTHVGLPTGAAMPSCAGASACCTIPSSMSASIPSEHSEAQLPVWHRSEPRERDGWNTELQRAHQKEGHSHVQMDQAHLDNPPTLGTMQDRRHHAVKACCRYPASQEESNQNKLHTCRLGQPSASRASCRFAMRSEDVKDAQIHEQNRFAPAGLGSPALRAPGAGRPPAAG